MHFASCVVVLAAVAIAASSIELNYIDGINFTDVENLFPYRFTSADALSSVVGKVFAWKSSSVDPEESTYAKKVAGNAMIGLGALPGSVNIPFAVLAYGTGKAAVDMNAITFAGILLSVSPTVDVAFEGGVIAMAALGMEEVDPQGNTVGETIPFRVPLFSDPSVEEITGDDGNLNGYTCNFSPAGTTAKVTVTYVASKKAGYLDYGHTPVSPRSFEMVIEVKDFPLTSSKNHVRMNVALLSANGAATLDGNAKVIPRFVDEDDLYIAVSNVTSTDDKLAEVQVDITASLADYGVVIDSILTAALGANYDSHVAKIDFPAGATNFVYDPALGVGSIIYNAAIAKNVPVSSSASPVPINPPTTASGASAAALSLVVALVSILFYLF